VSLLKNDFIEEKTMNIIEILASGNNELQETYMNSILGWLKGII
jgi:hypothetical protein